MVGAHEQGSHLPFPTFEIGFLFPVPGSLRPAYLCIPRVLRLNPTLTMPYVITEACIGTKDKACVDVCPVDCIYEGENQLFIHPDECIDCGACEPECPVTAIFPEEDVPGNLRQYVQLNREVFKGPNPPGRPTR
jgi:ferredoxin